MDVALRRPPGVHAHTWTWVLVEPGPYAGAHAEEIACQMAACVPGVVMPIGARVIDWNDEP